MIDLTMIIVAVFLASLIAYVGIKIKIYSDDYSENLKIKTLEKISKYFSDSQSLEKALRLVVAEQPSLSEYAKIVQKIDEGVNIETAISEVAGETRDEFLSKICDMLVYVNRKNDATLLYNSIQKIKETYLLERKISSKADIASWTLQFVFCVAMPMIYFFMISIIGIETDAYLTLFLSSLVIISAIFQSIVFRQVLIGLIKVPLLFSVFYILYFKIAPSFFSSILQSIV